MSTGSSFNTTHHSSQQIPLLQPWERKELCSAPRDLAITTTTPRGSRVTRHPPQPHSPRSPPQSPPLALPWIGDDQIPADPMAASSADPIIDLSDEEPEAPATRTLGRSCSDAGASSSSAPPDTNRDGQIARALFGELNRDMIIPGDGGFVNLIGDSDEEPPSPNPPQAASPSPTPSLEEEEAVEEEQWRRRRLKRRQRRRRQRRRRRSKRRRRRSKRRAHPSRPQRHRVLHRVKALHEEVATSRVLPELV
ncbi:hypothetical protein PVAP13_4KG366288 [Panicum virgatum]|uniref:Uncharacterized protein n=1 Tax=Panicum virgatum TaxID=38727 RepID=A0A8T0TR85_PANVG|nr:hypothetical protein PVAP13_4KG366288 [Panicum virgatum]